MKNLGGNMFYFGRIFRDARVFFEYPIWVFKGRPAPDNHLYKRKRIINISNKYSCVSFIETGTFYGQMINSLRHKFSRLASVELYEPLFQKNKKYFSEQQKISIYYGDSSEQLENMIENSEGKILFWLDGHYSGSGTALGSTVCPVMAELDAIKAQGGMEHCILIDDARLFNGTDGYPELDTVKTKLLTINPSYNVYIDGDCIVATS